VKLLSRVHEDQVVAEKMKDFRMAKDVPTVCFDPKVKSWIVQPKSTKFNIKSENVFDGSNVHIVNMVVTKKDTNNSLSEYEKQRRAYEERLRSQVVSLEEQLYHEAVIRKARETN
jgi:hypothetical protein